MKINTNISCYIDECGDGVFYGHRKKLLVGRSGFQPVLSLGMVMIEDPERVQRMVSEFIRKLKEDDACKRVFSFNQSNWYLHARGDHPTIKGKFFSFLQTLEDIKVYIILGRKNLNIFNNKHNNNEQEFYFDLVYHLLKDRLDNENCCYDIFLSAKPKTTQQALNHAIQKAIRQDNAKRSTPKKISYSLDILRSQDSNLISIIDYFLWALNRYIMSDDAFFFTMLKEKYTAIIDLYDDNNIANKRNQYVNPDNPFDIKKASPFRRDGYN